MQKYKTISNRQNIFFNRRYFFNQKLTKNDTVFFYKKHLMEAISFKIMQQSYHQPITDISSPTVVGVGRELVRRW